MKPQLPLLLFSLLPLGMSIALPSRSQEQLNKTPVLWEPIVRSTTPQPQHTRTKQANSDGEIEWELVPKSKTANELPTKSKKLQAKVVWSLVPETPQLAETTPATKAGAPASAQKVVWEVIPGSINPLGPTPSSTLATKESAGSDKPPADAVAFEDSQPARRIPAPPPPPPALQALNRSIAFGDGSAGPDIGWRVPNGFLWSRRWFADLNMYRHNRRQEGDDNFLDWGDGVWILHTNLLQTNHWSVAVSTSFRSLQPPPHIPGGSTGIDDGLSSGFRSARSIGETGGIAFGAEQLIQWDDQTDTGRNLYLMASKGWWLGNQGTNFPLLIANGGFVTGNFSWNSNLRFTCAYNVENRPNQFSIDNDLCWAPIGTVALVINEYWSVFTEYSAGHSTLSASVNLDQNFPLRIT